MTQYQDARHALRMAAAAAPAVVGWAPGGWCVYRAQDGAPNGVVPEFLVVRQGVSPIPLSDHAGDVWASAVAASAATGARS